MNDLLLPISRAASARFASQHFGPWAVDPRWFRRSIDAIRAGTLRPETRADDGDDDETDGTPPSKPLYQVSDGVALVGIEGQMVKRAGSFGGCSTIRTRQAIRTAVADPAVRGLVVYVSSPGGTVAGTADLADDVAWAAAQKPTVGYAADLAASAGYWVLCQCPRVYASRTTFVGCIGTYALLSDDTAAQEKVGIRYQIVSTGPYKGLGTDGAITDELVEDVQREIDDVNQHFLTAVKAGRGPRVRDMTAVSDGRAWIAAEAKQLGLIDEIASLDAVVSALSKEITTMTHDEFVAFGNANPEWAKAFRDAGYAAGKKDGATEATQAERGRFKALADAYPDRAAFAAEQFAKGNDVAAAKADLADVLLAENAELRKQAAEGKPPAGAAGKQQTPPPKVPAAVGAGQRPSPRPVPDGDPAAASGDDDKIDQKAAGRKSAESAIARIRGTRRKPADND